MVRLKIAYWEFDFEAVCPTLDHDLLSQAHMHVIVKDPVVKVRVQWIVLLWKHQNNPVQSVH